MYLHTLVWNLWSLKEKLSSQGLDLKTNNCLKDIPKIEDTVFTTGNVKYR